MRHFLSHTTREALPMALDSTLFKIPHLPIYPSEKECAEALEALGDTLKQLAAKIETTLFASRAFITEHGRLSPEKQSRFEMMDMDSIADAVGDLGDLAASSAERIAEDLERARACPAQ